MNPIPPTPTPAPKRITPGMKLPSYGWGWASKCIAPRWLFLMEPYETAEEMMAVGYTHIVECECPGSPPTCIPTEGEPEPGDINALTSGLREAIGANNESPTHSAQEAAERAALEIDNLLWPMTAPKEHHIERIKAVILRQFSGYSLPATGGTERSAQSTPKSAQSPGSGEVRSRWSWLEEVLRQETHLNAAGRCKLADRIIADFTEHFAQPATPPLPSGESFDQLTEWLDLIEAGLVAAAELPDDTGSEAGSGLEAVQALRNHLAAQPPSVKIGDGKDGVSLIAAERARQVSKEGFDSSHDDTHDNDELAIAAACYALNDKLSGKEIWDKPLLDYLWPWEVEWWKPEQSRVRNLVKAGALIAAEIDRLNRAPQADAGREEK